MEYKPTFYAGIAAIILATSPTYASQAYQDPVSSTIELFTLAPAKMMEKFANKIDKKYSKQNPSQNQIPQNNLESKSYQENQNQRPKRPIFRRRY